MTSLSTHRPDKIPYDFQKLLTHRILILSNTLGIGATRLYAKRYGILLSEWRLLAALMIAGPSSVNSLAVALATDKGWISRTVSGLGSKGLVKLKPDTADARRSFIVPTSAGRVLYKNILPSALDRQNRLISVLTEKEQKLIDEIISKLQLQAEKLIEDFSD